MRRWTRGEDELARELVADGYRFKDVAAELGRTYEGVRKRMNALRVRPVARNAPDADLRVRALGLVAAGVDTSGRLAAALGCRKFPAFDLLRRMERDGLVRRTGYNRFTRWLATEAWRRAGREDGPEEAAGLAAEGLGATEIATRLGVHRDTVWEWLGR